MITSKKYKLRHSATSVEIRRGGVLVFRNGSGQVIEEGRFSKSAWNKARRLARRLGITAVEVCVKAVNECSESGLEVAA